MIKTLLLNIIWILSVPMATWVYGCFCGIKSFFDKGFCSNLRLSSFSVFFLLIVPQIAWLCVYVRLCMIMDVVFIKKDEIMLTWKGFMLVSLFMCDYGRDVNKEG